MKLVATRRVLDVVASRKYVVRFDMSLEPGS